MSAETAHTSVFTPIPTENSMNILLTPSHVTFIWYQLLLTLLLENVPIGDNAKKQFVHEARMYYKDDQPEQKKIDEFVEHYNPTNAIYWYTRDSFVYRLLNRALRTENVETIFRFRFFIKDLFNELKPLHNAFVKELKEKNQDSLTVYRGRTMPKMELEQLMDNQNGYASFNSFLSTTIDPEVAKIYAGNGEQRPKLESILYEIHVPLEVKGSPFANISGHNYAQDEKEILFGMGCIFRIDSVTQTADKCRWTVKLTLTTYRDDELERLRTGIKYKNHMQSLSRILQLNGMKGNEERFYNLLNEDSNAQPLINLQSTATNIYCAQEQYSQMIDAAEKGLTLLEKHQLVYAAFFYNQAAIGYRNLRNFHKALELYRRVENIYGTIFQNDSSEWGMWHQNIATCYRSLHLYSDAAYHYEATVRLLQKRFPLNHWHIASVYVNMGTMCWELSMFNLVLPQINIGLKMLSETLPHWHWRLRKVRKDYNFYKRHVTLWSRLIWANKEYGIRGAYTTLKNEWIVWEAKHNFGVNIPLPIAILVLLVLILLSIKLITVCLTLQGTPECAYHSFIMNWICRKYFS